MTLCKFGFRGNRTPVSRSCGAPTRWLLNSHLLASTSLVAAGTITFAVTDVQAQQIDIADGQTTTINTLTPFDDINFAGDGRLDGTGLLQANGTPTTIDVTGSGSAFIDSNIGRNGGNGITLVNGDGGTGTLTMTGKLSGTSVIVQAGTLILNNDDGDAIGDTDGLTVRSGATISLQTDETVSRISGVGSFVLNANTLTFAGFGSTFYGVMSGTGGVVINAGDLHQFAAENTYTGSTTVNGGTLTIGLNSPPPGEGVILDSNAVLVNGGELILDVSETIGSLAGTGGTVHVEDPDGSLHTLTTGGNNASTTFGGSFSGGGILNKRGTGTFTLSGDNTGFDGTVTVSEGTLSLATTAAGGDGSFSITTTGSVIDYADGVTSAAPIDINSNTTQLQVLTGSATQSGVISETGGARPMEKIGDGTLTLTGTNTYTGGTTVTAGTLQLGNGGTTGSVAGDITNNAALIFNRSDAVTLSDVISGSGTVTKAGAGTLTLTGTNTYTGDTTVTSGTLVNQGTIAGAVVNNASFTNQAGGTTGAVTSAGTGSNAGTIASLINTGGTFTNTGTITAGASNSDGTTTNTGAIGGALVVSGGVFNQNAGGTLVGNTTVSGGQLNLNGTGTLSSASVTVNGGTLSTDGGSLAATAGVQVTGGTFALEGDETITTLTNAGTVTIGAGNTLAAAVITNSSGTIRVGANATLQGTGNTLNNSSLIDVATNGTVSDAGAINNLANGVINFNGPGGTATFASTTTGSIFNDGTINVVDGDVLVSGNLTNQGSGQLGVAGGDMTGIGVLTNTSTATSGVSVGAGRLLSADSIVNSTGAMFSNAGTLTVTRGLTNATGATLTTTGTLNGAVTNRGTLNATGTINGAVTNGGVFSTGGSGAIAAVTINGNLVQTADGSLVVDVDRASSTNDRLTVTGTADLAGTVDLNLTGADPVGLFTIVSAGGGVTDTGLALGTMQTFTNPLTEVQLVYPNANDVALNFSFNAEAGTFNSNQTNTLTTLNAINTGHTGETGPVIQGLFNLGSVGEMRTALNQLSPEIALNTETASLFSAANFTNSLFSCPVEGGAHAFIREGDCLWLRPQGRLLSVDETEDRIGFEERVGGVSVGGQYQVWTDWHAGFGLGYEQGTLDSNAGASARSDRLHLGGTLKYQHGALLIAGAVSGGVGAYETTRSVNFGGLRAVNKGDYDISYAGAQMRLAYLLEESGFYAKPQVDLYLAYLDRDGFTETGNSATALSVDSSEETNFSVTPAIEIGSEHALSNGWTARMRLKAGVTLSSQGQNSLTAHFAGAPAGAPGFESTSDVDNVLADVEAGVMLLSGSNTALELGYQGRLSPGTRQHAGFIKASLKF
ncbi:autotransporter domain-containing protein [Roseibium porphyridii]|uniref:Autotransporter domain-containing protein n=1 Tax=Roseibium porphyridii TaxID=2866279 RepID=A0ABY8EWV4_9HYPH|nr:autotransporter domain-containing protein [Roseibium sp. KMA01]WFE87473.1 autotransporter domain-containing protein [Roseibium sp. KMA01]